MNQNEIKTIIWNSANSLRGILDSSIYKDYILTMLFVKYLSDLFKEEKVDAFKKANGDTKMMNYLLSLSDFVLNDNSTFDYILQNKNSDLLGEVIDNVLLQIEQLNENKLKDVFRNIKFNSEINLGDTRTRNSILRNLIESFNKPELTFSKSNSNNKNDILGDAYEQLIGLFASDSGKKGGEFYTPQSVSILISKLVEVKENETIYDPTCGSGSLLIRIIRDLKTKNFSLFGQEKNNQTYSLARMNMFLHNEMNATIWRGDTLRNPQNIENNEIQKFDIVIANPPFSLAHWGIEDLEGDKDIYKRFERGVPPKDKGDYAFVQHMISSLKDKKGRMACVLPEGPMFRSGSEGRIRQKLIEENLVDTIIKLPNNLFYGTGIGTVIFFARGNNSKKDNNILFIDASKDFKASKNQNELREEDLIKIVDAFKQRKSIDRYSYLATIDEVKEKEFNLSVNQYVSNQEPELEYDLEELQKDIQELTKKVKKGDEELEKLLKESGIWK